MNEGSVAQNCILKRILYNKSLYVSLLIGMTIAVLDHVAIYKRYDYEIPLPPQNAFMSWCGFIQASVYSYILYSIIPLLVVLPAVGIWCEDIKNGYFRQLIIRKGKKLFYSEWAKGLFISGFLVVFIILSFSFLISMGLYPCLKPESYVSVGGDRNSYLMELFFKYPFIYTFVYIILNSLIGGVLSLIAAGSFYVFYNKVVAMLFPFIIYYLLGLLSNILNLNGLICPSYFLKPSNGISSLVNVCTLFLLVAFAMILWQYASHRNDEELIG